MAFIRKGLQLRNKPEPVDRWSRSKASVIWEREGALGPSASLNTDQEKLKGAPGPNPGNIPGPALPALMEPAAVPSPHATHAPRVNQELLCCHCHPHSGAQADGAPAPLALVSVAEREENKVKHGPALKASTWKRHMSLLLTFPWPK